MDERINTFEKGKGAMMALIGLTKYLSQSPVERRLQMLVEMRVSQINGCAYCLDMHSKDLRADGETEQRIHMLPAWRETPLYTDRERGALAWTEAVTLISDGHVPDYVYEKARKQFSEEELIDLTLAITTTNTWNRINIAFRSPTPGTYDAKQIAAVVSEMHKHAGQAK